MTTWAGEPSDTGWLQKQIEAAGFRLLQAYLAAAALCPRRPYSDDQPPNDPSYTSTLTTADGLPADFAERDPRPRWGAWNRARTALSTVAFLANCAALPLALAR